MWGERADHDGLCARLSLSCLKVGGSSNPASSKGIYMIELSDKMCWTSFYSFNLSHRLIYLLYVYHCLQFRRWKWTVSRPQPNGFAGESGAGAPSLLPAEWQEGVFPLPLRLRLRYVTEDHVPQLLHQQRGVSSLIQNTSHTRHVTHVTFHWSPSTQPKGITAVNHSAGVPLQRLPRVLYPKLPNLMLQYWKRPLLSTVTAQAL